MELRQLECFVAVAEELHFGRAAARLCMTQPPLSRQIQLLEQHLGVPLLERTSRVVQLTAAGRSFLRDARHLLAFAQRSVLLARRAATGETGHITLGFTAVAGYRLMPELVMRANRVLPDVSIELREMVSGDLGRLLLTGELDVILARHIPPHPSLAHRLLEREPLVVAMPQDSSLTRYETVPLEALDQLPFILYSQSASRYFHERIVGAFGLANVHPRIVQSASQTHTVLTLVRTGLGVGIVPDSARDLRFEGVVFRPIRQKHLHAEIFMAWRSRHDNPALAMFLDEVAQAAFEEREARAGGAGGNAQAHEAGTGARTPSDAPGDGVAAPAGLG